MAKLPYMQFYPADYQADVRRLSMATQGAWMQILCALWRSPKRGRLTLTPEQWAREIGCTVSEFSLYLTDLEHNHVGKISRDAHETEYVTIISPRIVRDDRVRRLALKRLHKHRDTAMKRFCNAGETLKKREESESESESESELREEKKEEKTPQPPKGALIVVDDFETFWRAYPRKTGKEAARKAWKKARDKPPLVDILQAIDLQKQSDQWAKDNGQFIPNPSTWLNQGRWADEIAVPIGVHDPNGFLAGIQAFVERG